MKKCPKCKRTYASDEFTFCLDDGALLSAPYNSEPDKPAGDIFRSPPQTEVLPVPLNPTISSTSPPDSSGGTAAVPTTTVPNPPAIPVQRRAATAFTPPMTASHARKTKVRIIYIAAPLLLIALIVGGIFIYASRCPTLKVYCSPGENSAGCVVDGPPFWANMIISQGVSWQWSAGGFRRMSDDGAVFDTTGFTGKQITVTATYKNWWCTTSASTSFVAQ